MTELTKPFLELADWADAQHPLDVGAYTLTPAIRTLVAMLEKCRSQRNLCIYAKPGEHIPRVVKYDAELKAIAESGK